MKKYSFLIQLSGNLNNPALASTNNSNHVTEIEGSLLRYCRFIDETYVILSKIYLMALPDMMECFSI